MKTKMLEKLAKQDAAAWAAAEMAYGEGAGTRRKLLDAQLDSKFVKYADTNYADLFYQAYENLDLNKYAELAIKERKAMDRAAAAGKNLRAIKSGNLRNLSTGVFVVVGGVWLAHETGYDEVIKRRVINAYKDLKIELRVRKARRQGRNVEKIA